MSTKANLILHIIRLTVTNFGIIKAAAIHPDGSPIVICGDNGAGKSTLLLAIESVLYGRKLAAPVTTGQEKAQIKLELAEPGGTKALYKIEQVIKNDDDGHPCYNLKIMDAAGKQVASPVKFIESLILSGAALDPTEIMNPRPGERPETFAKRQAETLMERLGLAPRAKKMDAEIETKAGERKTAKDKADELQTRLDNIEVPPGTPDEPVDVSALSLRMTELNNITSQRQRLHDKIQPKLDSVNNGKKTVERLEKELAEAKASLAGATKLHADAITELETFDDENPPMGIAKALEDVMAKMTNANAISAAVQKKKERKQVSTELAKAEADASNLQTELEKLREDRLNLVRKAKLPVEGLKLTEDALLFNGKPLIQESTGNMTRVCAELAMAEDPECRVVFIREGSLLNTANKAIIFEVAKKRGYQCWVESFSEKPLENALWIEGGKVEEA
jgi:DNA repair exonuclease SbcCD ATPase subunit